MKKESFFRLKYWPRLGSLRDLTGPNKIRTILSEFICTLILVFFGTGAVVATGLPEFHGNGAGSGALPAVIDPARTVAIALAFGLVLVCLVAMTSSVSGGCHANPSVTLAFLILGYMPVLQAIGYVLAQLGGALCASLLLKASTRSEWRQSLGANSVHAGLSAWNAFEVEAIVTFFFVLVILGTACAPTDRNQRALAPVPIGFALAVGNLVLIAFDGASINPARSFGPAVVADKWSNHWVFWAGPLLGSCLASLVHAFVMTPSHAKGTLNMDSASAPPVTDEKRQSVEEGRPNNNNTTTNNNNIYAVGAYTAEGLHRPPAGPPPRKGGLLGHTVGTDINV